MASLHQAILEIKDEFEKSLTNAELITEHVASLLFDPSHPEGRPVIASPEPLLRPDIRERLIEFYESHYSSTGMRLVVVANTPLDNLQNLVASEFTKLPQRKMEKFPVGDNPFGSTARGKLLKIKTLSAVDSISLNFQLPADKSEYRNKSAAILAHIIEYKGPGGLQDTLNKEGLSSFVSAVSIITNYYIFLKIKIIPKGGIKVYESVFQNVMNFLSALRSNIPAWICEDLKKALHLDFLHYSYLIPLDTAMLKAQEMFMYTPPDYFNGPFTIESIDKMRIENLAGFLKGDNMFAILSSNTFCEFTPLFGSIKNVVDSRNSVMYAIETLKLPVISCFKIFTFPSSHPYNSKDFANREPILHLSARDILVWWQDDDNLCSHGTYKILIQSRFLEETSEMYARMKIFSIMLTVQGKKFFDNMVELGFDVNFSISNEGLELECAGYVRKLPICMLAFAKFMSNFEPDPHIFDVCKSRMTKWLSAEISAQVGASVDARAASERMAAMVGPIPKNIKILESLCTITSESFKEFKKLLFLSPCVQALVVGVIAPLDAISLVDQFMDILVPGFNNSSFIPLTHKP